MNVEMRCLVYIKLVNTMILPVSRLMGFFYRNYDAEIFSFGERLGEKFQSETLRTAFTNRSDLFNP